jgi:hypothetical protein
MKRTLGHILGETILLRGSSMLSVSKISKFMMLSNGYGNPSALLVLSFSRG